MRRKQNHRLPILPAAAHGRSFPTVPTLPAPFFDFRMPQAKQTRSANAVLLLLSMPQSDYFSGGRSIAGGAGPCRRCLGPRRRQAALAIVAPSLSLLTRVIADNGYYGGRLAKWASDQTHITLEIIRRGAQGKGFEVLPRRWVVERTFACIFKNRRLVPRL